MSFKNSFQNSEQTITRKEVQEDKPRLFKVILHNDDYTPMDFVVMILETIFNKSYEDAVQIMLAVHSKGVGLCGIYTGEIAEHKTKKVNEISRDHEYPLKCTMEPE